MDLAPLVEKVADLTNQKTEPQNVHKVWWSRSQNQVPCCRVDGGAGNWSQRFALTFDTNRFFRNPLRFEHYGETPTSGTSHTVGVLHVEEEEPQPSLEMGPKKMGQKYILEFLWFEHAFEDIFMMAET